MKKNRWWLGTLMVCLGLSVSGCGEQEKDVPPLMEPVGVEIDTEEVKKGDLEDLSWYAGTVVPHVESLCFTEDGVMETVYVHVGDFVTKGQVLAEVSQESLEKEIQNLEQQIRDLVKKGEFSDRQMQAQIRAEDLELELMWEKGEAYQWKHGTTIIDYNIRYFENEAKKLSFEQSKELREFELSHKRSQLKQLKAQMGSQKILAPFDGQVVYVGDYSKGNRVAGFETVICLADERRLNIVSDFISESDLVSAEELYCKIGDKEYPLEYIPYTTEEYLKMVLSGKNMETRFLVEAEAGEIVSGQYAAVIKVEESREDVLYIPSHALYQDGQGKYVYKIEEGERVRNYIQTGLDNGIYTEVAEGLAEGDVIYTKELLKTQSANQNSVTLTRGEFVREKTGSVQVNYLKTEELSWDTSKDTITDIPVKRGQEVKAGEVLAVFDVPEKRSEMESLKLQLKRKQEDFAKSSAEKYKAIEEAKEYAIYHYMYRELEVANLKIEKQQAQYEQYLYEATNEIEKLKEQIKELEKELKENCLVAPFDGVIDWVAFYNPGDPTVTGSSLIRMYSTEYIVFETDESSDGLRYNMDVEVEISYRNKKTVYEGRVIAAQAILPDDVTQKKLVIRLNEAVNPKEISGNISYHADVDVLQDVIVIERKAVSKDAGKDYVYVLEDGAIQKRYVTTGPNSGGKIVIVNGLEEGQILITD